MTQVKQWGNSLAIRVPKEIARQAYLAEGSRVILSVKNRDIVIVKTAQKKETLRGMVARITPQNRHELVIPADDIVGNEAW